MANTKQQLPSQRITEAAFTSQVIALARWYKWRVAHFRPAMTKRGNWVTAVQGDGAGFPDLVLVRNGELIFAELKSARGTVKPGSEQEKWLRELSRVALLQRHPESVNVYVWKPQDITEIERILM